MFFKLSNTFFDIINKLEKYFQDKRSLYITIASAAAAVVIMIGAITGFLIPVNENVLSEKTELLKSENQQYISAVNENEKLSKRVEELYEEMLEVNSELERINDYEIERNSSKKDIDDVSAQIEELKKQIDAKQLEIDKLDSKIRDMGGKITLSPGMYTVGKHISAGEYNVTGDGSLLVSDSQSKLKINTRLTESESHTCSLSEGDIIKLETEAIFNAAG